MRGFLGVVAGLIIGAAISFAVLAAAVTAANTDPECHVSAPDGWLIQVVVPWSEVQREVSSTRLPVAGGSLTIEAVEPAPCGRTQVWAAWEGAGVGTGGLGLTLESTGDASRLRPVEVAVGRLRVSLRQVPDSWLDRLAAPVAQAGGAALARRLQGEGMGLCGLVGLEEGLALFLCAADD